MSKKFLLCAALIALLLTAAVAGFAQGGDIQVGDTVVFGLYEQDNNLDNGPEPIEWRVLLIDGNEAQLVSVYALDAKPFNLRPYVVRWTKSWIRTWLNEEFYDTAFGDAEKAVIVTKEIPNWKEDPTTDPVYLLDCDEAKELFSSNEDRQTIPTPYAIAQGAYQSTKYGPKGGPGNAQWWLRTHSWEDKYRAAYVAGSGGVMTCGGNSDGKSDNARWTIRPAIYVDLSKLAQMESTQN